MPIAKHFSKKVGVGGGKWHFPTGWGKPELDWGGTVFGTWEALYEPGEFERVRSDGTTVIGLVPDCRVFICGAEVTPDVSNVNVSNSFNGNKCDISLTNPRGRYEISRADLRKKWREDKDVLAAYNYDIFKRQDPFQFEKFMDQLSEVTIGKKRTEQIKKGLTAAVQLDKFLFKRRIPEIRGTTRQIFEIKHFSGITKRIGDVVFDYRDPVYVFFKGRFSPYWYFAFSGIVVGWDDEDAYQSTQEIKIKCEDITSLWKRTKLTKKAAFYPSARMENRLRTTSQKTRGRYTDDLSTELSFSSLIKIIAFSYDYGSKAFNCHASSPGTSYRQALSRFDRQEIYEEAKQNLHLGASIDTTFMFTKNRTVFRNTHNTIKTSEISYPKQLKSSIFTGSAPFSFTGGPNNYPFSPNNSLYLQLNEIELPEFQAKNVKPYLDISVRFWESDHSINKKFNKADKKGANKGTGWEDTRAYGIAGTHPALTYDFINNFNIINTIWEECYKKTTVLDSLIMTPLDKIRSSLVGSPTEAIKNKVTTQTTPEGTQYNLFRPRLFLIVPQKFADRIRTQKGTITKIGELFDEEKTTVYTYLHQKLKAVEYIMYSTPMGDIVIEPEMYDSHPLEFSNPIEARNIIKKDTWVKHRVTSADYSKRGQVRYDKAYFYDTQVNHPFFLTEKDRIRCTQTFKHELVYTGIVVQGGQTPLGGVHDVMDDKTSKVVSYIANRRGVRGHSGQGNTNSFAWGIYIADGFEKYFDSVGDQSDLAKAVENGQNAFNKAVLAHLLLNNKDVTIQSILDSFIDIVDKEDTNDKFYYLSRERKDSTISAALAKAADRSMSFDDTEIKEAIYKNEFNLLYNYRSWTVKQLMTPAPNKSTRNREKTNSSAKANQSAIKSLMGVSVQEYEEIIKIIDKINLTTSTVPGFNATSIFQMLDAYAPIAATGDAQIGDMWLKLYEKQKQLSSYKAYENFAVVTIEDEKKLASEGLYFPRTDMVKLYGYNPAEPVKNNFIENGIEAYDYAKTVFNRYLGKAFEIHMDIVGRPELLLNRTCYCERKDSIGLISNFSIKWSHGSTFSSSVTLNYVRKNAITYGYDLGEIDPFIGAADNEFFQNEANLFYKWNRLAEAGADALGNKLTEEITGTQKGQKTIVHTTEKQTAVDGSALKSSVDIVSSLPLVPVAVATAKEAGIIGDSIAYQCSLVDTPEEGAVSYKLVSGVSDTNIVQLYDGDLNELSIGNFLVFISGSVTEGAEISNISGNTVTLSFNLTNSYPTDTIVTRMDWLLSFATYPDYSDIETKGPFPVIAENNLMFSQTFTLVDIEKSDKWYTGRNIYPSNISWTRLSGGSETRTITTKVITSKESPKSAKDTARKLAGSLAGNLAKSALRGFLPLGGLYTTHDKIGHMEFDKRGFTEKVEKLSFARAHSLGQSHVEDEAIYNIVSDIEYHINDRTTRETKIEELTKEGEAILNKLESLTQEIDDLQQEINSTATADEKIPLTNKKVVLTAQQSDLQSESESIAAEIAKHDHIIEQYNYLLYGATEIPSDLGDYIYSAYKKYKSSEYDTVEEYYQQIPILESYYYRLYDYHMLLFGGEPEDWRVTETDPESITLGGHGSTPYYIKKA